MEVSAHLKNVRMSAQKVRLVADLIRGKQVASALDTLAFSDKKAAKIVKAVLDSAIANAEHNKGLDVDELNVSSVFVNQAATIKRFRARAKGRGARILKRGCHITVSVAER